MNNNPEVSGGCDLNSFDFGFTGVTRLSCLSCIDVLRNKASSTIGALEVLDNTDGLATFRFASQFLTTILNIYPKFPTRSGFLGSITSAPAAPGELHGSECLKAILAVAQMMDCEYLIGGDEDVVGRESSTNPLCPQICGLYHERLVGQMGGFSDLLFAIGPHFSLEEIGGYHLVIARGGLLPNIQVPEDIRLKFLRFSRIWTEQEKA